MNKILSFGGGVNSMALLCLIKQGKVEVDDVVFADPGSEMPETYKYIEKVVKPFCNEIGIPFNIVSNGDLYKNYYRTKAIPFRLARSCTVRYKIVPINKYAKKKYGENYITLVGIDAGEKRRMRNDNGIEYPLVELGINRNGCKQIIKKQGLPIPVKSGCYFCPFQKVTDWKKLFEKHPELYELSMKLEKNGRAYPKYHFGRGKITLEVLKKAILSQTKLFEGSPENIERCVFCHS